MQLLKDKNKLKLMLAFMFMFALLAIPNLASAASSPELVNLTVPSNININQSQDGSTIVSDYTIKNESTYDYKINSINVESKNNWDLSNSKENLVTNNEKKLYFSFENNVLKTGANTTNIAINHNSQKKIALDTKLGVFTQGVNENAFNFTINFALNPKTYNIKFNTNNGTSVENMTATGGSTISLPETTRAGYVFRGWISSESEGLFNGTYEVPYMPKAETITLTAKWAKVVNITFETDGGSSHEAKPVYLDGNRIVELPTPTKAGYTFKGWKCGLDSKEYTTSYTVPEGATVDTIKMVAQWTRNVTVIFDGNGASNSFNNVEITSPTNRAVDLPTPTRSNYAFKGWKCSKDQQLYTSTYNVPVDPGTATITLTAQWTRNVTVTFNGNGGSAPSTEYVTSPTSRSVYLPNSSKSSYTFDGWRCSEDNRLYSGSSYYTVPDLPNSSTITMTAEWTYSGSGGGSGGGSYLDHRIKYDAAGGTPTPEDDLIYSYDSHDLKLPAAPKKEHHDFLGWRCDIDNSLTQAEEIYKITTYKTDIKFTAEWKEHPKYTVTYAWSISEGPDMGVIKTTEQRYAGEQFTLPTNTLPSGHNYGVKYWRENGDNIKIGDAGTTFTMPSNNIQMHAVLKQAMHYKWEFGNGENSYTSTWNAGYRFNPPQPTRKGYKFGGWKVPAFGTKIYTDTTWNNMLRLNTTGNGYTVTCTASWVKI